nr:Transmembrane protein SKG6 [Hymenolepis microstoma]
MSTQVLILQPHSSYLTAFNEYYLKSSSGTLSTAMITGIAVGVVAFVLLIILIFITIYCCRHRRAGYRSAYDTDEAFGNCQLPNADAALRSKTNGHPDVKPELYI